MVEFWELVLPLLLGLLILQYLKQLWSSRNYPPGPFQLPIIGGIWWMAAGFSHDILTKLAKQYGNIYTFWLGPQPVVILSGYQAVKEGIIDHPDDFNGRPVSAYIATELKRTVGVLFASGEIWKQHRRFGVVTMRKMGVGRKIMENQIEVEAKHLVEAFACTKGQPYNPLLAITNAVSNVICAVAFGYRYSAEDEEFKGKLEAMEMMGKYATSIVALVYEIFPWMMHRLPGPHQKVFHLLKREISFAVGEIERHREHQNKHEPQDIIDFYLLQLEKSKDDPSSTYNDDNMSYFLTELFIAGTETTATSLQWALLFMVAYPEVQEKVCREMEEVLGSSESVSYQDQKNLPFTNAVIHEILRARYVLFLAIPRECVNDVKICGFHIPKGTFVVTDLRSVLLDPTRWETPEEFNPHHFLDKEGNFVAREEFLPFGAGARVCLGEQLAKMELFLFFTHLLRTFKFQLPEGVKELRKEPVLGFSLHPHPYKICAIPRNVK
ncbi:cytochrome P450 2J6-like [Sceloporus undulatus]|uniref:cytochrome P450 2J6-like n=1 Tax=Sceloporus undulatus TaxID=8520 RepID=UPI001C4B8346|nr:cytochrome P450 2J6-like [Sceloporus undulatus]